MHLVTSAVAKPMLDGAKGRRGLEGNRLLGKAGARRTDPLGPLAARSVPHAADLQTWGVSLVAQTGW
jgi:hypothetical protein